jgi:hypothetical protein
MGTSGVKGAVFTITRSREARLSATFAEALAWLYCANSVVTLNETTSGNSSSRVAGYDLVAFLLWVLRTLP